MHELVVSYHLIPEEESSCSMSLHFMYTVRIGNFIKLINSMKRIGTNLLNQAFQELCPVIDRDELGLEHMKIMGKERNKEKRELEP